MGDLPRADTHGYSGGSRPATLARADSVAAGGAAGGRGGTGGGVVRPGSAKFGPAPRRAPSIMPVARPGTGARAGPPPLPNMGRPAAEGFRVEQRGSYHGETNVPQILFLGKAAAPDKHTSAAKQLRNDLSKYKLRPGALEELGCGEEEEGEEAGMAGAVDKNDLPPYGGKREMMSLQRQIVETESAALESRLQAQSVMKRTQETCGMVENKVSFVKNANVQLDADLVQIESQIEDLKRISRSQMDEIKGLREANKKKETNLHDEQRELERMEGKVRETMASAAAEKEKERQIAERLKAGKAEGTNMQGAGGGANLQALGGRADDPQYLGSVVLQSLGQHEALDLLLARGPPSDAVGEPTGASVTPAQELASVGEWLAAIRAPSDWGDGKGSKKLGFPPRSDAPPEGSLELEHIHGYGGKVSRGTLVLTEGKMLIYPAASVVVLLDTQHNRQSFFLGHTDLVNVIEPHPEGTIIASGDAGSKAQILVWDSSNLSVISTLVGVHREGIADMKFSRDGNMLVSVDMADDHVICIWDWRKARKVASASGDSAPIAAVHLCPDAGNAEGERFTFVSVGDRHVKFWEIQGTTLKAERGNFEHRGSLQGIFSVNFLELKHRGKPKIFTLTGTEDGCIYSWSDAHLTTVERRAHDGPIVLLHTPPVGVTGTEDTVYSAGVDGKVRKWKAHQTAAGLRPIWTLSLKEKLGALSTPFCSEHVWVRGVAVGHGKLYVGTSHGEIYDFNCGENQDPVLKGAVEYAHALGPITGLEVHPARAEFVTVGADNILRWWTCAGDHPFRMLQLDEESSPEMSALGEGFVSLEEVTWRDRPLGVSAVCYSPDGEHIAIGWNRGGGVWVVDAAMRYEEAMTRGAQTKLRKDAAGNPIKATCGNKAVTVLKFSPDGKTLLVGVEEGRIHVLQAVDDHTGHDSYHCVKVLTGAHGPHAADVSTIDFNSSGLKMQTTDSHKGLAFWEMVGADGWTRIPQSDFSALGDTIWDDVTGGLGWAMQGIHPESPHVEYGVPKVNLAHHRSEVVAVDDFGKVSLYRYPCLPGANAVSYTGHAGKASHARFTFDDSRVLTAGAADRCIMQWKYKSVHLDKMREVSDPEVKALSGARPGRKDHGVLVRFQLKSSLQKLDTAARSAVLAEFLTNIKEELRRHHPRDFVEAQVAVANYSVIGKSFVDLVMLPQEAGWNVPPTPVQLADSLAASALQTLHTVEPPARKLPGAAPADDTSDPLPPWMGTIAAPSDWDPQVHGSAKLGYLPTDIQEARKLSVVPLSATPALVAASEKTDTPGAHQEVTTLELEHVYGCHGAATRGNLCYLGPNSVLFFAAAVGVVQSKGTSKQRFLVGHNARVTCLATSPDRPSLVATGEGGANGSIIVWEVSDGLASQSAGKEVARLEGVHLGGVVSLVFLGADRLVSVGVDAQHTVAVWEWESSTQLVAFEPGDTHDILAVAAAPNQAEEFVTVGVQHIKFWRLPLHSDTMIVRRGIVGNKGRMQTLTCAAFLPSGDGVSLLATGTEDGSIYIWRGRQLHLNIAKAHSGPVFDLVVSTHKAHVLISAGKDDTLHLWEVATSGADVTCASAKRMHLPGKLPTRPAGLGGIRSLGVRETSVGWASVLVGTGQSALLEVELDLRDMRHPKLNTHAIREVMQAPYGGDVTGLCAHPFVPEIASVGAGGVDFWDTTGRTRAAHLALPSPGACVDYSPSLSSPHIAVGCQDGTLIVFDCSAVPGCAAHTAGGGGGSAEAPVEVFRCQQRVSPLTVVRFSPDGTKVAVGSEDKVVDIYRADASYNRLGVCKFHREAVAHVDWSLDSKILRSNDEKEELLHWSVAVIEKGSIKKLAGGTKTADEQWASHRCSLTWAYQGLPTYMATPLHVLAVDRAHNGAYAAVGDVYGQVRLVRFPCLDKDAIHVMGASKQGHSAGVRDVRFLADDSRLLSVGGDDQAIFQWRIPVMGDREADPLVARIISALAPPITPLQRTAARPEDEEEEEEILTTLRPYHANVHAPKLWSRNGDMQPWKEDPWMLTSPVHDLELEHLYGFRGYDRHGNVLYTATGKTVLYTACVASVLDSASGFQRFFLGHTADLTCLALHPNGRVAASGQGGAHPRVFVWDSERLAARAAEQTRTGAGRSLALLSELDLSLVMSRSGGGLDAVAFSSCGRLLVTVFNNPCHSVAVWDWKEALLLAESTGDLKPSLAAACNPFVPSRSDRFGALVTCGVKHVRFWRMRRLRKGHPDLVLSSRLGDMRGRAPLTTMLSLAFTPHDALCGAEDGSIFVFSHDGLLRRCLRAHTGPVMSICAYTEGPSSVVVTADSKGYLKIWDQGMEKVQAPPEGIHIGMAALDLSTASATSEHVAIHSVSLQRRGPNFPEKKSSAAAAALAAADAAQASGEGGGRVVKKEVELDEFGQPVMHSSDEEEEEEELPVEVQAAQPKGDPKALLEKGDSIWKLVVGTGHNEVLEMTLPDLICSPDDPAVTVRESDTRKVYKSVTDDKDQPYPSLEVLVQTHAPGSGKCAVAAHPFNEKEVSSCGPDAVLRVWDLDTRCARMSFSLADAAPSLAAPPSGGVVHQGSSSSALGTPTFEAHSMAYSSASATGDFHLAVGCKGCIVVVDTKTSGDAPLMVAVLDRASGGLSAKEAVTSLSYSSPWGDVSKGRGTTVCNLAAGTSLGNVILFAAQLDSGGEYQKLAKIKAHPASVLAIDFSEAPEGSEPEWLRTTSADFELRFWGIQGGGSGGAKGLKEKRPASELRDQLWHSQTCALGWAVMGLDVDSGDVVPSIDRTPDRSACVSPSAKGALDLFRFPCLRGAAAKGYVCHSPNVSSVRFSSGGHNVFAIGGVDLAVSVWRRHLAFPAELLPLLDAPRSALSLLEHEEERAEWEQPEFPASLEAPLFSFSKPFLDTIKAFNKTGFDGVDLETMESFDDLSAKADLPLNTVLGFRGGRSLSAAHFSATGGVVYAAASIGVVQDLDATQDGKDAKQRLFKGHEDQILCVAVDAARQRVATGEVGAVSRICIWRATDCEFETALEGGHSEGVGALAFFSCGAQGEERDLLVSVGVDQNHSIVVWDIAARAPLVRAAGDKNRILSAVWNPFQQASESEVGMFVTVGENHVMFWHLSFPELPSGEAGQPLLVGERGVLGDKGVTQTALSACFIDQVVSSDDADQPGGVTESAEGFAVTGMHNGDVYVWVGAQLLSVITGVHDGPVLCISRLHRAAVDVEEDPDGLTAPPPPAERQVLVVTGGGDGLVRMWDEKHFGNGSPVVHQVNIDVLMGQTMVARTEKHRGVSSVQSVACRDVSGGRGVEVLVGTRRNELLTITLQDMASPAAADKAVPRVVALGHSGEGKLGGLAMHPAEDAFATFGDDGLLVEWALGSARPRAILPIPSGPQASGGRAVSYRGPDGADIALALHSGEVVVVRRREGASGAGASGAGLEEKVRRAAHRDASAAKETPPRQRDSGATVARFDPTGTYLAVGFDDGTVELLLAPEDYRLVGRCSGHADTVTHIDWATDGEILQTADASFEVYFWNLTLQVPGSGAGPDSAPEYQRFGTPILLHRREWAAQSCPLAWTLQGMFVPGQEGEGIGAIAVDRGPGKGKGPGFVLSAEASGAVRMYKFPCAQGAKPKVTAKGHASAVASVGMSCSRAFAVSVGGADLSALVWNIRGTGHLGI